MLQFDDNLSNTSDSHACPAKKSMSSFLRKTGAIFIVLQDRRMQVNELSWWTGVPVTGPSATRTQSRPASSLGLSHFGARPIMTYQNGLQGIDEKNGPNCAPISRSMTPKRSESVASILHEASQFRRSMRPAAQLDMTQPRHKILTSPLRPTTANLMPGGRTSPASRESYLAAAQKSLKR